MKYVNADLSKETFGLILNGVNCQRVMGSGWAACVRRRWPSVYQAYMADGAGIDMLGAFRSVRINDDLVVANCYTQVHYGSDGSRYADPLAVLASVEQAAKYAVEHSLVIKTPKIGCGLGGLDWDEELVPIVIAIEEEYDLEIEVFYI